jgi:hypothetical protein
MESKYFRDKNEDGLNISIKKWQKSFFIVRSISLPKGVETLLIRNVFFVMTRTEVPWMWWESDGLFIYKCLLLVITRKPFFRVKMLNNMSIGPKHVVFIGRKKLRYKRIMKSCPTSDAEKEERKWTEIRSGRWNAYVLVCHHVRRAQLNLVKSTFFGWLRIRIFLSCCSQLFPMKSSEAHLGEIWKTFPRIRSGGRKIH